MTRRWEDPTADRALAGPQINVAAMVEYLRDTYGERHGDDAGYQRHRRHHEPPCPDCRLGHAIYQARRRDLNLDAERARHRDYMRRRRNQQQLEVAS